jgi:TusA-related sulfurtransferase
MSVTHATAPPTPSVLDVRGIACPLAWAKAKVHLETIARGTLVDIVTDDARTVRDLPRAAEAAGHHVVDVHTEAEGTRIRLEV